MSDSVRNFYKKVSLLRDLKDAIKEVKKTFTASEPPTDVKNTIPSESAKQSKPDHKLQYLGRKRIIGDILSHRIGTHKENDNSYQMDVHLDQYHKGIPCIILSVIAANGEVLERSPDYYKNMKEAIKAIVNHNTKRAWK